MMNECIKFFGTNDVIKFCQYNVFNLQLNFMKHTLGEDKKSNRVSCYLGKPQKKKKFWPLRTGPLRGGGGKGRANRGKKLFFKIFFFFIAF